MSRSPRRKAIKARRLAGKHVDEFASRLEGLKLDHHSLPKIAAALGFWRSLVTVTTTPTGDGHFLHTIRVAPPFGNGVPFHLDPPIGV
jgi:hypothetical protein